MVVHFHLSIELLTWQEEEIKYSQWESLEYSAQYNPTLCTSIHTLIRLSEFRKLLL
jgi:hypothetical protein